MKESLEIRVYGIDGAMEVFVQDDPELMNRTLSELQPTTLFSQDQILLEDDCLEKLFVPALLTRIDLITDRFSVWDFPFALGALEELAEAEFDEKVRILQGEKTKDLPGDTPVYLDLEMLNGQRLFLGMQIVAGLPQARWNRIYSLLKERRLIFGLRSRGVGILNLSNLLRLSVHPDIPHHQKRLFTLPSDDRESSAEVSQL